jgi:UPF0716 protein FxsA
MALFILFSVVPLLELIIFIGFCDEIGFLTTLLLLFVMTGAGMALVRLEGFNTLLRLRRALETGNMPDQEVFNAFCIVFAGALMVLPGFLSDLLGFLLLLPPVRHLVRDYLQRRHGPRSPSATDRPSQRSPDPSVIEGEYETLDE